MAKKLSKEKLYACVVFAIVTSWAFFSGFFEVFSYFPPYDDEGYLMITVRQFLDGKVLYNEIYTQYGPVYYLYKYAFFSLTGLAVTHDVTRISTLFVLVLTGFCCCIFTFRISQSVLYSAISYVLSFIILSRTVAEPGHPQEISGLIIAASLLLFIGEKCLNLKLALSGVLLAALLFIKINLGIFFGLAILLAILTAADGTLHRIAQIVLTIAASLLPFIMLRKYFEYGWLRLSIVIAATLIAACAISLERKTFLENISLRVYLWLAMSFFAMAAAIVIATLLMGTTFGALTDGILLQHLKFGDDFFQPLSIQRFSAFWAVLALLIAAIFILLRSKRPETANFLAIVLKVFFGFAVLISSVIDSEHSLNNILLLSFATPFLWIVLVKTKGKDINNTQLAKNALVYASILLTLQVFPITGTQMAYATFLMVAAGAVSLSEGLSALKELNIRRQVNLYISWAANAVMTIALLAFCIFWGFDARSRYYQQISLNLPGASLIRLPEKDVETYQSLVKNINANCDNFVTMPGLYSLYFWTQKGSPTTLNTTAWMSLLSEQQQQSIVRNVETLPRLCAVYHPQLTQNGARNRDLAKSPLAAFIMKNFNTVSSVNDFQFMVRNSAGQ